MRLCLIGPIPPFRGGVAKYCHSLAKELEKSHDLLLLSYSRQYPVFLYGNKSQVASDIDRKAIEGEFRRLSYDIDSVNPLSWRRATYEISAFGADAVILPWWVVYWTPMYLFLIHSLKRKGTRVILLCINVFEHEDNSVKKFLSKLVLGRASHMIVHSQQERREILEFNPSATVQSHPLPLFTYHTGAAGPRNGNLRILFFGFIRAYKGLDILLKALDLLKERNVKLRVAGEFWDDMGKYQDLIDNLNIADMVEIIDGYISEEDMCDCFSWADMVVLPYVKARTSGIIATSYAFGKPVLATEVGGFGEVVKDGYTGRLVAPGDPTALAKGIEWFLANRGIDFAGNIAEFTFRNMSWGSLVDTIEGMIRGTSR